MEKFVQNIFGENTEKSVQKQILEFEKKNNIDFGECRFFIKTAHECAKRRTSFFSEKRGLVDCTDGSDGYFSLFFENKFFEFKK